MAISPKILAALNNPQSGHHGGLMAHARVAATRPAVPTRAARRTGQTRSMSLSFAREYADRLAAVTGLPAEELYTAAVELAGIS